MSEQLYQAPADDTFMGDFAESDALESLAEELTGKHAGLAFVQNHRLRVLWRRKGGKSVDHVTYGKCIKASGLTGFFAQADWVIWLAADHVRKSGFTAEQVEALLFHEMNHCRLDEDGVPMVVGHDLEIFLAEVEQYGLWRDGLKVAAPVFRQLSLLDRPD